MLITFGVVVLVVVVSHCWYCSGGCAFVFVSVVKVVFVLIFVCL